MLVGYQLFELGYGINRTSWTWTFLRDASRNVAYIAILGGWWYYMVAVSEAEQLYMEDKAIGPYIPWLLIVVVGLLGCVKLRVSFAWRGTWQQWLTRPETGTGLDIVGAYSIAFALAFFFFSIHTPS